MSYKDVISGIYTITHIDSGRVYVGSAMNIYTRWDRHRYGFRSGAKSTPYLKHAWNKYGEDAFEFKIVERVPETAKLVEREQYWIDYYQSARRDKGFNIAPKAGSNLGVKASAETCAKLSAASIGRTFSAETRKLISERMQGNKCSINKYNGKIVEANILPIFQAVANGEMVEDVGQRYSVHGTSIRRIIIRETWDHVLVPEELIAKAQSNYYARRRNSLRSDPRVTTLNPTSVGEIKRRLASGETKASLAREYGVTEGAIYGISRGRIWKDVTPSQSQ